jgi:pyruvate formate-lyase activating enzyme-like uncharacterized protein
MIIEVNENTLPSIQNLTMRSYAETYVRIDQGFMEQVRQMGVEVEGQDNSQQVRDRIAALKKKGASLRNDARSISVNRISSGCQACQTGIGSATFFISLKCHRDCFYCFNPNQEHYQYFREHTRDVVSELKDLHAKRQRVRHLALTGGEPLLHKDETIRFFQEARQDFPDVYTRLYTCGDHLERETLQALKDARMDEIRFSIRMHDLAKGQRHTYDQITLAREYIPNVMVEMPVLPGTFEEMKEVLLELDRLGIYGINLLEFCFPLNNAEIFRQRGYTIKARPYRVLYNYWYAGGLPVAGSESVCLDLVEFAMDAKLKLGVHYCSLENKHSGQVYQQNVGQNFSKTLYFSQKDYFLKSAKVFGDDIEPVRLALEEAGYKDYRIDKEFNMFEFHVSKVNLLKKMEIEVGISTAIIENRDGDIVLRELKLDVTTPQMFKLSDV